VIFNNICIGSTGIVFEGSGNYQSDNYASTTGTGIFVNRTSRDYHLVQNSPAIGYGVSSYLSNLAPPVDFNNNARTSSFDAGAYEYVTGVPVAAPATPNGLSVQ
jgi:hypothetical protein